MVVQKIKFEYVSEIQNTSGHNVDTLSPNLTKSLYPKGEYIVIDLSFWRDPSFLTPGITLWENTPQLIMVHSVNGYRTS